MKKSIKNGFTLAEVLITLAIIGVVAAMTLPTLILKHQKQQWVTGLQNAYSTISNGLNLIKTQEGTNSLYDTEFFNGSHHCLETLFSGALSNEELEACSNILKQYFKIVDYKNYDFYEKSDSYLYNLQIPAYILNNGIALSITPGFIFVDVNGNKKPNQYGRDKFILQYFDNGKVIGNAISYPESINEITEMLEDIYVTVIIQRDCTIVPSNVCGTGQAIDDEFTYAIYQQKRFPLEEVCYDFDYDFTPSSFDKFWSCNLAYAAKTCPGNFKPYPDNPEFDGSMFCAARIMADGWKMNY